jgi:hypothetical protein
MRISADALACELGAKRTKMALAIIGDQGDH